mgnify:CR=1 FL=1
MDEENRFIPVIARFDVEGGMVPLSIEWNGHVLGIDRVLDIRKAPSLKHGGFGIRFTVRIRSTCCYLFCDEGKWFIEREA